MTKVTVLPTEENVPSTPSEKLIAEGSKTTYVESSNGLRLKLKKPTVWDQLELVKLVGDAAQNAVYMQMVMPSLWVVEINGEPSPLPSTMLELRARLEKLDEEGISAVLEAAASMAAESIDAKAVKN